MTTDTPVAQDQVMAELHRVGTQQESLKKAVAEAMSNAKERGGSMSIAPTKSNLMQLPQQEKAATEADLKPLGIGAGWTKESTASQEAPDSARLKAKHAAVQQVQDSDAEARAESLPKQVSRKEISPVQPVSESKAADPVTQAAEQSPVQQGTAPDATEQVASAPEPLVNNPDVQARRLDLSKMQVALGHEDTSGATAAAFVPSKYTLGFLPSQGGMWGLCVCECIMCAACA